MASALEQLQIRYQGRTVDANSNEIVTNITYIGSRELCENAMRNELAPMMAGEFGTIESVRMSQDEGPHWLLEVRYTTLADATLEDTGTAYGPKRSQLSTSMISRPIESVPKYKRHWNNNLYYQVQDSNNGGSNNNLIPDIPAWWWTDDAEHDSTVTNFMWGWGKSVGDLSEPKTAHRWRRAVDMTKPRC